MKDEKEVKTEQEKAEEQRFWKDAKYEEEKTESDRWSPNSQQNAPLFSAEVHF